MANLSSSFLKLEDEEVCLLCKSSLKKDDTVNRFTQKGWQSLINYASKWSKINMPPTHEYFMFPALYESIKDEGTAFGQAHENCRIVLSTKSKPYRKKFGELSSDEKEVPDDINDEKPRVTQPPTTRTSNGSKAGTCFICTIQRGCDANSYNTGGLRKLCKNDQILDG